MSCWLADCPLIHLSLGVIDIDLQVAPLDDRQVHPVQSDDPSVDLIQDLRLHVVLNVNIRKTRETLA